MSRYDTFLDWFGRKIAERLTETSGYEPFTTSDPETLRASLRPGDVLLVEGSQKVSSAIKYLTQSTWSHAALYVGDRLSSASHDGEPNELIEVNLGEGCIAAPLGKYSSFNTRICRPVGLMAADRERVVTFMISHLGDKYDMRNILDLARYLFPTPPIPARWRRRMISIGSGEPTRAICSTLIAQAFQTVRYPILPRVERAQSIEKQPSRARRREIYHIRHHSLFAPCDFDLSPYFQIIKPTIERGFDYKSLRWSKEARQADEIQNAPEAQAHDEAGQLTAEPNPARTDEPETAPENMNQRQASPATVTDRASSSEGAKN